MADAKHTQGPWHISTSADSSTQEVLDSRGVVVCEVGACSLEDDANARLIAAAPTIAAEAMAFTLLLEHHLRADESDKPATARQVAEAMYALRALLAKASA